MATWNDVARIVATLPETVETPEGGRQWRVRKKLLAWQRPLRKKEIELWGPGAPTGEDILAARVPDVGAKEALVADDPSVYFTIPHFDGYPAVLVHLGQISAAELKELLVEAWLCQAPKRLAQQFTQR